MQAVMVCNSKYFVLDKIVCTGVICYFESPENLYWSPANFLPFHSEHYHRKMNPVFFLLKPI